MSQAEGRGWQARGITLEGVEVVGPVGDWGDIAVWLGASGFRVAEIEYVIDGEAGECDLSRIRCVGVRAVAAEVVKEAAP